MVIAVSAKFFSWIATAWGRSTQSRVPKLWTLALLFLLAVGLLLTIGGVTSGLQSDHSLHDTYYVVAHFHYVLSLGAVFAIFAGWYYLFPKVTGYVYNETLGKLHFWLTFIGTIVLLFPPSLLALTDMPRRIADYPDSLAYMNWWSSLGSYLTAAGTLVFAVAMLYACFGARSRHG